MMSGKTLAAMIALFTMPIVARLFLPSDFGVAAIFVSVASIVSVVATLRYEAAVVIPKDASEAVTIMAIAYRIAVTASAILLVVIAIYEINDSRWNTLELLGHWKWLLPFTVLLLAALYVSESWLTRTKRFKTASASLVAGNTITTGTRIGFGFFLGSSIYGLIVGYVIGLLARLAIQHRARGTEFRELLGNVDRTTYMKVARKYADFPQLNAPAALIFSAGQNLPVLLFGAMFSPAVAGLYAMANRLTQVPVAIVATSMRRVFLQKAAAINHSGRSIRRAFLLATGGLSLLGTLPLVCIWIYGQELCTWLLGDRWTDAGHYLEIMAPWLFMLWVEAPCNPVFVVLRKQKFWLLLQSILTLLRLGAFGMAFIIGAGPDWTLQAFVIVSIAGIIATMITAFVITLRQSMPNV